MMEDTAAFINELGLDKPVLLGASDGGITGLLLAIQYPGMLSGLIACGANTHPSQIIGWFLTFTKLGYLITRNPKMKMMLDEPDISKEELNAIQIPTLILAGSRDIIPESVTMEIASAIPGSEVKLLKGETHDSYLRRHKRVMREIEPFLAGLLR
jgi:pimeloyl-ACP methyl ester carboxylesterase